jgi:hypothetical protein
VSRSLGCRKLVGLMGAFLRKLLIVWVALAFLAASAPGKRVPPKPVSPVISNGIRYSAEGDGRDQYVVAADASSGHVLWRVKVFHNHIKFWIEEDVQWVFITDLKLIDNSLLVRDERPQCYSIDLMRKNVKKLQCGNIF